MPLTEDDIDRISDKIHITVMGAVSAAMDRHVETVHDRCEATCLERDRVSGERIRKAEEAIGGINTKIAWAGGLLVGLGAIWEFVRKKIGL